MAQPTTDGDDVTGSLVRLAACRPETNATGEGHLGGIAFLRAGGH